MARNKKYRRPQMETEQIVLPSENGNRLPPNPEALPHASLTEIATKHLEAIEGQLRQCIAQQVGIEQEVRQLQGQYQQAEQMMKDLKEEKTKWEAALKE